MIVKQFKTGLSSSILDLLDTLMVFLKDVLEKNSILKKQRVNTARLYTAETKL